MALVFNFHDRRVVMSNFIKKFFRSEKGAETLEYVVIAAVIILIGAFAYRNAGIGGIITNGINTLQGEIHS